MTDRTQVLAAFLDLVPRMHAEILSDRDSFNLHGSIKGTEFDLDCRQIIAACEGLSATCATALRVVGVVKA